MKEPLFFNNIITEKLNFRSSLCDFRILLLIFFLGSSFAYAQKVEGDENNALATMVLKNGAKLYSTDDNFNQQILGDKVVLKGSEVSYVDTKKKQKTLMVSASEKPKEIKKTFQDEVKTAKEKKQQEDFKKVKKEINNHEERKKAFQDENIKGFPSSQQFISSTKINHDYVAPSSTHDFSKIYFSEYSYVITLALDYLHTQKFNSYNSKSLAFCSSEAFSLRPPPHVL